MGTHGDGSGAPNEMTHRDGSDAPNNRCVGTVFYGFPLNQRVGIWETEGTKVEQGGKDCG
ncbi:hypothetical protein [Rossellomorea marisflavi]|uniref:hypothetical protein n=1 Tax=Rossellomorea marisflavi TaxID=189381 RepID=UPI00345A78B4